MTSQPLMVSSSALMNSTTVMVTRLYRCLTIILRSA